jgi:hypothetical protein
MHKRQCQGANISLGLFCISRDDNSPPLTGTSAGGQYSRAALLQKSRNHFILKYFLIFMI